MAAALPPLWSITWFAQPPAKGLTWRRGLTAFAGGATISVAIAVILEILLPAIFLTIFFGVAGEVMNAVKSIFAALAGKNIAAAITNPGFIYIFIQVAIIAPLAEEFAKPLITLPLIRHLPRKEAFLIGALAGAGFASLENVLYAGFGFRFWAGIIAVRALGGAIHPLGSGLVALGWRGVLRRESDARSKLALKFGAALGIHSLWNGGSLLVITLAGAKFFGEMPPQIDVLGLSAAGITLALLAILGLAALWGGRALGESFSPASVRIFNRAGRDFVISDRAAAILALAFLLILVPAGIAGMRLLLR
jgi:RsiW-degrading membrane proteinase PrsW (M82 family)